LLPEKTSQKKRTKYILKKGEHTIMSPTITRRSFLQGTSALGISNLLSSTALASIDPHSFAGRIFHASHYGPFEAIVSDNTLINITPVVELDARPTEMLTMGIMDRTYDKSRINFPMVRKSYLKGWKSKRTKSQLRGKEEFVRVDWDTAINLASKAILDSIEKGGNESIFNSSYGGWSHAGIFRPNVMQGRFFNLIGGCTNTSGDWSAGASQVALPRIIGDMEVYSAQTAWEVIRDETELFVLVGCDPIKNNRIEYRVADHSMYEHWKDIRNAGVKFLSINPQKTASDEYLGADWLRIIPNTDIALFLAMAYHVLDKNLEDKDYLAKYTVGSEKWIAYVKGENDNIPKTPKWAESITGIKEQKIKELAELIATSKTQIAGAWSLQRAHHGEMVHWALINFAALTGKIGKKGQGVGFSWHYGNGGMPQGGNATPSGLGQGRNPVHDICPASRITEMLERPGRKFTYNGVEFTYPKIRMIYNAGNNFMSHQQDTNRLLKALRKVKTIVSQDVWWTAATQWADIVLPASSTLERDDISSGGTYSNDRVYAMKKIINPIEESKSDYEIFELFAEKMGVWTQFTDGLTYEDHIKTAYAKSGASEPFEQFWKKGYALMPIPQKARKWSRHEDFYQDPKQNALHTESGKIEMFCDTIAKFNYKNCPGMPVWLEPFEYLGNAKDGQLHIVSPHPWYRLHSQMENSKNLRSLYKIQGREPVRINAQDAKKRNIKAGDLVELYNKRGRVIAGAIVSDEIMPGVVSLYEGCWPQLDKKGRCNSGAINFLTSANAASELSNASVANTCLVSLKKCKDPQGPNTAYDKPTILEAESVKHTQVTDEHVGLERIEGVTERLMASMEPDERLFYASCTVCHAPRVPSHYTQLQWKGILPSMFERAGLNDQEQNAVTDFLMKNASDAVK
jgi:trimethylamine-N-oxide reductase (cytochrome c)